MMEIRNFIPREYQEKIFETTKQKNTLVVLPTGLGKTACAIMLAVERLNKYPDSKVLICSPTKPLCDQHTKSFKENTDINENEIVLFTGATLPKKREELWKDKKIIIATPQTIESDIKNKRISLENFSMLCIDECHRSKLKFANTIVAKNYIEISKYPLILALTASPGSTKEGIDEICKNLYIESVEIRTAQDEDVKPYVKEKEVNWVEVDLPEEFNKISILLKNIYNTKAKELKNFGLSKPSNLINKRDLLFLQKQLQKEIEKKNNYAFYGISLVASIIKLNHCIELLETQGLNSFKDYINKLRNETSKAAKSLLNDKNFIEAIKLSNNLSLEHPKIERLRREVEKHLKENEKSRIIIFANYRNMVKELISVLNKIPGAKPIELVGQKEGLTQKEQIKRIEDFSSGVYNILIGTSISEEGLNISSADHAIFYEPTPSEIRDIQRRGRVGRLTNGKVTILITKNTRDQAYYWVAKRKEQKMKKTLYKMQEDQASLKTW